MACQKRAEERRSDDNGRMLGSGQADRAKSVARSMPYTNVFYVVLALLVWVSLDKSSRWCCRCIIPPDLEVLLLPEGSPEYASQDVKP